MQNVMIVKIPKFLALTPKYQIYDELWEDDGSCKIGSLPDWMNKNSHLKKTVIFDCAYFVCKRHKDDLWRFIYHVNEQVKNVDISPYEVIEFEGGLYATATFIENDQLATDLDEAENVIIKWLESMSFVRDEERDVMENYPYADFDVIGEGLGYQQKQCYIPIKFKESL